MLGEDFGQVRRFQSLIQGMKKKGKRVKTLWVGSGHMTKRKNGGQRKTKGASFLFVISKG